MLQYALLVQHERELRGQSWLEIYPSLEEIIHRLWGKEVTLLSGQINTLEKGNSQSMILILLIQIGLFS
jgi:hypothetical protein